MDYASIVVTATGANDDAAAVSVAYDLARRFKASATVVIVVPQMAATVAAISIAGGRYARSAWRDMADSRDQLIQEVHATVNAVASRHPDDAPAIAVAPAADDPWHGLERELPLADMVVMGHSAARGEGAWTGLLADALMAGRAPVLIAGGPDFPAGGAAAVAWDGSPEAGRALRAATPLLKDASEVTILQHVGELHETAGTAADPERAVTYLKGRGVTNISVHTVSGPRPGAALLGVARDLDAGLFVAGAFGHARLAETIFGGATRTFLHAEAGLHLFLSH